MAGAERWYFTKEQLLSTPSRKCGLDYDKELSYRQQAANFIQDMGQRLHVTQLCINTAIVYMHRFYMFHSFSRFHRNAIAACALFLAAKVEEQPRKLEHVIKVSYACLHRDSPPLETKSEAFSEKAHELVTNENIMLQTLGFDIAIDHPHTYVVKCCQLVRASKDLAQTSYFMATNSLHLTTMCLQYKPTVVACVCIHLACKWTRWEIPRSSEGKDWFWYIDRNVTLELLEELTTEFLAIVEKCPSRLKRKIMSGSTSKPENPQGNDKRPMGDTPSTSGVSPQSLDHFGVDGRHDFLEMAHEHLHQQKLALPALHSNSSQDSTSSLSSLPNSAPHSVPPAPASVTPQPQQQSQPSQVSAVGGDTAGSSLHHLVTSAVKVKQEPAHSITLAAYKEMKERREKELHATSELKKSSVSETKHSRADHEKRDTVTGLSLHPTNVKAHPTNDDRRSHHMQSASDKDRSSRHHHKSQRGQTNDLSKSQGSDISVHKGERHTKNTAINMSSHADVNILDHSKHQILVTPSIDKHETNSSMPPDPHLRLDAMPLDDIKPEHLPTVSSEHGVLPLHEHKSGVTAEMPSESSDVAQLHHTNVNVVQSNQPSSQSLQDDTVNERLRLSHSTTNGAIEADSKSHRHAESSFSKSSKSKSSKSKPSPKVSEKHQHSEEKRERKRKSPIAEVLPPKPQNMPTSHSTKAEVENLKSKERSQEKAVENHVSKHEKHKRSKHSQEKAEKASSSKSSDVPLTSSSGGLKITIPKDKIILTKPEKSVKPITIRGTGTPPREALKIKIPKVKITKSETPKLEASSMNSTPPLTGGLKLRITKDRIYSSSQKSEQESRKRERSPKDSSDHRTNKTSPSSKSPKIARTEAHTSSKKASHSLSHIEQDAIAHEASHTGDSATRSSSKHKHGGGDHVGNGGGHHSAPNKHMIDNAGVYAHAKGAPQIPPHGPYMMSYGAPPQPPYPYQQYMPYAHPPMHMRVGAYPQHYSQVYPPMPPPPTMPIPEGPPLPKEPPPIPPPPPPPE